MIDSKKAFGNPGLLAAGKFFGVILLAIAVKVFESDAEGLIKQSQIYDFRFRILLKTIKSEIIILKS